VALFGRKKLKASVLVIDDDRDLRATVEMRFRSAGFEVFQAADGEEGLALAAKVQPTAIILDVNMPGIDGFETCRRLRKGRRTRDIPVIMLTACKRVGELEEGLEAGADTYLTKPFDGAELVEEIKQIVASRGGARPVEKQEERSSLRAEVIQRMRAAPRKLGDVARAVPGVLLGRRDDRLITTERSTDQHRSILFESDVELLATRRPTKYMRFTDRIARSMCPDSSVFEEPKKVLVRRTAPPLIAALDTGRRLVDKAVICVVPVDRNTKAEFLLGFLASNLATFALENVVERVRGGQLPWVSPAELERLPLPGTSGAARQDLESRLASEAGEAARKADAGLAGPDDCAGIVANLDGLVAEGFGLGPQHLENLVSPTAP
jgi:CheY-like chemotaxis protein